MDVLWLGYDGLSVVAGSVKKKLLYRPALDARIVSAYGRVPANVRAVVMTRWSRDSPAKAQEVTLGAGTWMVSSNCPLRGSQREP